MRFVTMAVLVVAMAAGATDAHAAQSNSPMRAAQEEQTAELTPHNAPIALEKADRVVVLKSERKMALMRGERVLDVFTVALGRYAKGQKQREGDQRTPEGRYVLEEKLEKSKFYRAIKISYPTPQQAAWARQQGLRPGGMVEIHGLPNGWTARQLNHPKFDWTDGCIAVTNAEMDRVWARVDAGTPIEIYP
jgi:murein L,D-transpeptidase YafK